ncbi:MAG: SusC/RagA family TonB-linked outer membrane protein [Marinifilaceae bacterium]
MKKKPLLSGSIPLKIHYLKVGIRFLTLVAFACYFCVSPAKAEQYNPKISLQYNKALLVDIIKELKEQTGIRFFYNDEKVNKIEITELTIKDKTVEEVMDYVLSTTDLTYTFHKDVIVIKEKDAVKQNNVENKHKVTGKVMDKNKDPLPGATITIKGTTIGCTSDVNGIFNLLLPPADKTELIVSFIGMKPTTVRYTGQEEIIVMLEEDNTEMEEVVVTGIFERPSGTFTGAATTLKADDLKRVGNTNLFASLRNLDPSLMILDNMDFGSDPNQNPKMTLRGSSAFDLNEDGLDIKGTYGNDPNAPLFVLDGFEASVQKIMDLDMDRVESVTILKDASAKAIYGSKAANGVIVIETKKSSSEDVRVSYTGTMDIQKPDLSSYNLTNAREKLELEKDAGLYDEYSLDNGLDYYLRDQERYNKKLTAVTSGVDTDWLSLPLRTGIGTKHFVSFELGKEPLKVIADFTYNNIAGVMKGSERNTYAANINVSYRTEKFLFRNIMSFTSNIAKDSPYGRFDEYAYMNPYYTPYDQSGRLVQNALLSVNGEDAKNSDFVANPLYNASLNNKKEQRYFDFTDNLYIEWRISRAVKATARLGITEKRNTADEFYPSNHLKFIYFTGNEQFRKGSYQQNNGHEKRMTGDLNAQVSKMIKDHYVFLNVGGNIMETSYEEVYYTAEGFPNDKMNDIIFAKQFLKESKPMGRESTIRNLGILSAFNYSFKNKYLFDASYRASASSQFGKNNPWGHFWSAGIGWNLHNEAFFKSHKKLEQLRLRASYGHTGSQSNDAYESMATYKYFLDKTYQGMLGGYLKGMKNDDLKWQLKADLNIGLDININRRLILAADYYVGQTKNTLIDFTIAPSNGFTKVKENIGTVKNSGYDIKLTYTAWQNTAKQSYLTLMLNVAGNKNIIKNVTDAMQTYNENQNFKLNDPFQNEALRKYYDGASMTAIWAVPSLGIDPSNGREIYRKPNGDPTYEYNPDYAVMLGDELPKLSGTAGIRFQYKGLGINVAMRYMYGAQMYNKTLIQKVENADLTKNVDRRLFEGRWRKEGDIKPYKSLSKAYNATTGQQEYLKTQPTSRFVQDRNEFSIANLSVDYEFKNFKWMEHLKLERMKLSFNTRDLYMYSTVKIERGTYYPFARGYNFSLGLTF